MVVGNVSGTSGVWVAMHTNNKYVTLHSVVNDYPESAFFYHGIN